jgi:lysophospholipase L1-like esterase
LAVGDDTAESELPRVVIVGDSIRLSYADVVTKQLAGEATIISPRANGGDSSNVLKHLDAWVIQQCPAVVHFNCGIHDTKKFRGTGEFQISPEQYARNLRNIVQRIRQETGAIVLYATTTPILDQRAAAARSERDYELLNASVNQYNAIAKEVMCELSVPINDLNALLSNPQLPLRTEELIGSDGVHLTPDATKLLGDAVARFVREHMPPAR